MTAVLDWVNRTRKHDLNMPELTELPRGMRHNAEDCVLARALRADFVASDRAYIGGVETWVIFPPYITEFVKAFDAGQYPELTYA